MIYLASDHAGFEYKSKIIEHLKRQGLEVEDCGAFKHNPSDDYPDFIYPCAEKVSKNPGSMGIIFGGSGQGEAIVANKVKGIRAAVYYGNHEEIVMLARQHNNANVLSVGARFMNLEQAERAVDIFIETRYEGGRHDARIEKINQLEK